MHMNHNFLLRHLNIIHSLINVVRHHLSITSSKVHHVRHESHLKTQLLNNPCIHRDQSFNIDRRRRTHGQTDFAG